MDTLENKSVEERLVKWIMNHAKEGVTEEEIRGLVKDLDHTLTYEEAINRIENPPCIDQPNCIEAEIYARLDPDKLYSEWQAQLEEVKEQKSTGERERTTLSWDEAWSLFCETMKTYGLDCEEYYDSFKTLWDTSSKRDIKRAINNLAFALSVMHKKPAQEQEMEKWFNVFCEMATANGISCDEYRRRFEDEWRYQLRRMSDEQRRRYLEELIKELVKEKRTALPAAQGGVFLSRKEVLSYIPRLLLEGRGDFPPDIVRQAITELQIHGKSLMRFDRGSALVYTLGYVLDTYAADLITEGYRFLESLLTDVNTMEELYEKFLYRAKIISHVKLPDDFTKKIDDKEIGEYLICALGYALGKEFGVKEIEENYRDCYEEFISLLER